VKIAKECRLDGKRILFIGIGFYEYEEAIRIRLEHLGASVSYFLEQPLWHQSALFRRIGSILGIGPGPSRDRHLRRLLDRVNSIRFDYVFVIKGELLSEAFLRELKGTNGGAQFILYQWDSLQRVPEVMRLLPYFDRVLSFDRQDCMANSRLIFRPLFYRTESRGHLDSRSISYDLSFIGWLHSDRLDRLRAIEAELRERGLRVYIYLYTGIGTYLRCFLKGKHRFLHVSKLPFKQVTTIVRTSRCILDLPHPNQSGLTMRSIEAIGMQRKLVTTNVDVVNYDFYDHSNILFTDKLNSDEIAAFIERESVSVSESVLHGYTLDSWLGAVFGLSGVYE
jgi:hypothetical protein